VRAVGVHTEYVASAALGDDGAHCVSVGVAAGAIEVTHTVSGADFGGVVHGLFGVDDQHLIVGCEGCGCLLDGRQQYSEVFRF